MSDSFKEYYSQHKPAPPPLPKGIQITRAEFDAACEAVWSEIEYQNTLDRRTDDEAKSVPSFCAMGRLYIDRTVADWADNPGVAIKVPGKVGVPVQVPKALDGLRKVAAIFLRGMIYCGVRHRI